MVLNCVKKYFHDWHHEGENHPNVDILDIGSLRQVASDGSQHGGQNQHGLGWVHKIKKKSKKSHKFLTVRLMVIM